jgi:hypothetical protein
MLAGQSKTAIASSIVRVNFSPGSTMQHLIDGASAGLSPRLTATGLPR